jgi:hypothetical protein
MDRTLERLIDDFEKEHGGGGQMSASAVDMSQDAIEERMKDAARGMIKGDRESGGHSFEDSWKQVKDADTPGRELARDAMRKVANEEHIPLP